MIDHLSDYDCTLDLELYDYHLLLFGLFSGSGVWVRTLSYDALNKWIPTYVRSREIEGISVT